MPNTRHRSSRQHDHRRVATHAAPRHLQRRRAGRRPPVVLPLLSPGTAHHVAARPLVAAYGWRRYARAAAPQAAVCRRLMRRAPTPLGYRHNRLPPLFAATAWLICRPWPSASHATLAGPCRHARSRHVPHAAVATAPLLRRHAIPLLTPHTGCLLVIVTPLLTPPLFCLLIHTDTPPDAIGH